VVVLCVLVSLFIHSSLSPGSYRLSVPGSREISPDIPPQFGILDTGIVPDTGAICHDSSWHIPLSRGVGRTTLDYPGQCTHDMFPSLEVYVRTSINRLTRSRESNPKNVFYLFLTPSFYQLPH
jgi:hypothetical protein